ncbi:MAG: FG-GAP-like repeat-containing protein, partial [Candidatus Kapaibacteriota bacterium]
MTTTFEIQSQEKKQSKDQKQAPIFREVDPEKSGIKFLNLTPGPPELKKESRLFTIASGGTSVGDVNGDGLIDIYLTSFIGKNTLFINKGKLKFEPAPESAGVTDTAGYSFGSTMIDIDADGDLDIFVTKYNHEPNKLFINDGKGFFTERAKEFGLATIGNGIQSTFFDYDLDGDLDVLIVNNGLSRVGFKHEGVTPILMKNNGNNTFSDVTSTSGIDHKGFGLSATAADINNDGWPDLYIANDFEEKDYLYINTKNGSFERKTRNELPHTVMFGMGNDVADFNNDNLLDIIVVDMLPEVHVRLNSQFDNFNTFNTTFDSSQFIQNTLQLNRGNGRFTDIAQMSGVDATEWSWTVFFADFNLDGNKDLFVANGLNWDIMDKDLRRLGVTHEMMQELHDKGYKQLSESSKAKGDMREIAEEFDIGRLIRDVKRTRVPNYLFKNNGDLTFSKVTNEWGMDLPYNTCSSSYADFDNDGDIDLILNNIDPTAVLYENTMMNAGKNNYLKVSCIGNTKNTQGLGARIQINIGGKTQLVELAATRGFASGVAPIAHFGLGSSTVIDELIVTWPGGKQQKLTKVKSNQHLTLNQSNAVDAQNMNAKSPTIFSEITNSDSGSVKFLHKENDYDDFYTERLLPNQLSINGPALASGDLDGNGLSDIVIGGPQGYPTSIFLQMSAGAFSKAEIQNVFKADSLFEDQGILLFDAELDGDLDIYTMNIDGTNVRRVTSELGYDGGAFFSADGKKIIYRAYHPKTDAEIARYKLRLSEDLIEPNNFELWIMDAD